VTAEQLLAPLHPNENALTPLFQANVDEGMLREIAEADYGWKADECFALLQPVLNIGSVAIDDDNLTEVLNLIRWSEPQDPNWRPGGQGARGHWMRLFACNSLVRFAPKHRAFIGREIDTFVQLIGSAIDLGRPVAKAAASVLAWRFLNCPGDAEDPAFLAFGILLLAAHFERADACGLWLKQLADWVEEEEACARANLPVQRFQVKAYFSPKRPPQAFAARSSEHDWLLGLSVFNLRQATWRSLADRILAHPETPHPREADESLRLLGELVAGTS